MRYTEDLRGRRYNKLTVLNDPPFSKDNVVMWKVECECGKRLSVRAGNLRSGNSKSCGCSKKTPPNKGLTIDLTGQRFGRLVTIEVVGQKDNDPHYHWRCICDCGKEVVVSSASLRSGTTKSCGCLRSEVSRDALKKKRKYDNSLIGQRYNQYKHLAIRRGLSFNLSYEEFSNLVQRSCFYCGDPGRIKTIAIERVIYSARMNGIDRVDNRLGYDLHNVVPSCSTCNSRKGDRSVEYLKARNKELGIDERILLAA